MFHPIQLLKLPKNTIKKVQKEGFYYCNDSPPISDLDQHTKPPEIKSCLELLAEESCFFSFDTHHSQLNRLFGDLIKPGTVTELCGLPGSGKTQMCFYLASATNSHCLFIDTKLSFAPQRIREILRKTGRDENGSLQISCIEAGLIVEFLAMVAYLEYWLVDKKINLLIIDSITWPLRQVVDNERTSLIYHLFEKLRNLANLHTFAIVLTNDLSTKVHTDGSVLQSSALGDGFYHIVNNRILLSTLENGFEASVLKGSTTNCTRITFIL